MTRGERNVFVCHIAAVMDAIGRARAAILDDDQEMAQILLSGAMDGLLEMENVAGCYTPTSLFGD